ncbi:UvrD-helicase domain-containing protein [Hahella sp. CR1]|uniref:UvrD-helicase domain-containing protein n=1 Tax=Hahella sp. CR1 TaxID=2992807 RepID=UPI0024423AEC|nr:UvrD-helicase domain-containing protein [Hahella sp. CR1]MDG9671260.1 UvrD-helicase domain-containing protein [Hahella sp. CR1]
MERVFQWLKNVLIYFAFVRKKTLLRLLSEANENSFQRGYEEARQQFQSKIEIVSSPPSLSKSGKLLPETEFHIDDLLIDKVNKDLYSKEGVQLPTEAQKELIFSKSRNTLVLAGAGSGKSTTLVQRLLVMHKYLKIPLEEITVFSFTRASCEDFRKKLIKVFNDNGIDYTYEDAKKNVRTFHSKVYELARNGGICSQGIDIFEFLKETESGDIEPPPKMEDVDNISAMLSNLTKPQRDSLHAAYSLLYKENNEFKALVDELYLEAFSVMARTTNLDLIKRSLELIEIIVNRDLELCERCYNCIDLPFEKPGQPYPIYMSYRNKEIRLHANYYLNEAGVYIVVSPDFETLESLRMEKLKTKDKYSISLPLACNNKVDIISHFKPKNVIIVRNNTDKENLLKWCRKESSHPPIFEVQLQGEFKPKDILSAFYDTAVFIESLGVKIASLSENLHEENLTIHDQLFIKAISIFFPYFDTFLARRGITRFNCIFAAFSDAGSANFDILESTGNALLSLKHILIDEFQDISPQEVNWLEAVLHRLKGQLPSLIRVGDDYQSIYGWRGSSPEYILNKSKAFTSNNIESIVMEENFRSYQDIVCAAESALDGVSNRSFKRGKCTKHRAYPEIELNEGIDLDEVFRLLQKYNDLYLEIPSKERRKRNHPFVLLLARKRAVADDLKSLLEEKIEGGNFEEQIMVHSFHTSKGLESEYTILIGGCDSNNKYPLRNLAYKMSRISEQTYDIAQLEEGMRLAYVALTRAMIGVHWFVEPKSTGIYSKVNSYLSKRSELVCD